MMRRLIVLCLGVAAVAAGCALAPAHPVPMDLPPVEYVE